MENFNATPDELLSIIGKQQVILEKQARALTEITYMYNQLMEENNNLKNLLRQLTPEKEETDGRLGAASPN